MSKFWGKEQNQSLSESKVGMRLIFLPIEILMLDGRKVMCIKIEFWECLSRYSKIKSFGKFGTNGIPMQRMKWTVFPLTTSLQIISFRLRHWWEESRLWRPIKYVFEPRDEIKFNSTFFAKFGLSEFWWNGLSAKIFNPNLFSIFTVSGDSLYTRTQTCSYGRTWA